MKYRLNIEKRMEGFTGNVVLARLIAIVAAIILTVIVLLIAGFDIAKIPRVFEKLFFDTLFQIIIWVILFRSPDINTHHKERENT